MCQWRHVTKSVGYPPAFKDSGSVFIKSRYFVADSSINFENFLFVTGLFCKTRRVIKTNVNSFGFARKDGALFISIIANRYNIIEPNVL